MDSAARIKNVFSDEALQQLLKLIVLSANSEPYVNDIAPSTNSAYSSVKLMETLELLRQELKQFTADLVGRIHHLQAKLVNETPTMETSEVNVMYYYSLSEDGQAPYNMYLKIDDETFLDLGTTSIQPVGLVNNLNSDSSTSALSAAMGKFLALNKLDIQQNSSQAGKGLIVGEDGKLTLGKINSELTLSEREW